MFLFDPDTDAAVCDVEHARSACRLAWKWL